MEKGHGTLYLPNYKSSRRKEDQGSIKVNYRDMKGWKKNRGKHAHEQDKYGAFIYIYII